MSAGSTTPSKSVQLNDLSIPRLFFHLLRTRFTGELRVQQDEPEPGERSIWVRGGMPVFTNWVSPPDSLGELLISRRVISRDLLERALKEGTATKQPLGQILLQDGSLDPTKLSSALRLQCARKLLNTFRLREGNVQVIASETVKVSEDLQGQVNVLQMIHRGISAHYDEARVREEMGAELDTEVSASKALTRYQSQFGFQREDAMLLRALMRGATLDQLSETHDRAHAAHVMFALWTCQMLRTGGAKAAPKAKPKKAPVVPPPIPDSVKPEVRPGLSQPPPAEGALPPPPGLRQPDESKVPPPPGFDSRPRQTPPEQLDSRPRQGEPPESHENIMSRPPAAPSSSTPERAGPAATSARRLQPAPSHRAEIVVDAQRRAELETELDTFEALIKAESNAFMLFGLELDADRSAIRARWADLSKRFHPDTVEAYGLAYLSPRMESVFAAISEAYGVLSNKDERARLVTMLAAGGTGKAGEDTSALVKNALEADMLVRDGEKQLGAGRYQPALDFFRKADALNSDDPSIAGSITYCTFALTNHNRNDGDAALEVLEELAKTHPAIARLHYYIGMVLVRSDGSTTHAAEAFQKAYNLDKRLVEAQRQLHALQVKKRQARKDKKKKGGFGGLFGR